MCPVMTSLGALFFFFFFFFASLRDEGDSLEGARAPPHPAPGPESQVTSHGGLHSRLPHSHCPGHHLLSATPLFAPVAPQDTTW